MSSSETAPVIAIVCPHCQSGSMRLKRVVYARWHGPAFITMPNFPGWVCDVCGQCEYDQAAVDQICILLGPAAGGQEPEDHPHDHGLPNPEMPPMNPRTSGRRRV
jgi:YgiT-type zinc finger domain-containing protein